MYTYRVFSHGNLRHIRGCLSPYSVVEGVWTLTNAYLCLSCPHPLDDSHKTARLKL